MEKVNKKKMNQASYYRPQNGRLALSVWVICPSAWVPRHLQKCGALGYQRKFTAPVSIGLHVTDIYHKATYVVRSECQCTPSGTGSGHRCSCPHSYSGCYSVVLGIRRERWFSVAFCTCRWNIFPEMMICSSLTKIISKIIHRDSYIMEIAEGS